MNYEIELIRDRLTDINTIIEDIEDALREMEEKLDKYDANEGRAPRKRGKNV